MKKFATVLTAIVMLFASTAFASNGDNVTAKVKAAFQTDFSTASKVSWKQSNDFYFASFTLNDVQVDAAYNEDGELVGTSRKVSAAQMPLNVTVELSKKYADYSIAGDAYELSFNGQTNYYIKVENDKQVLNLKCYSNGEIDVESRSKKS